MIIYDAPSFFYPSLHYVFCDADGCNFSRLASRERAACRQFAVRIHGRIRSSFRKDDYRSIRGYAYADFCGGSWPNIDAGKLHVKHEHPASQSGPETVNKSHWNITRREISRQNFSRCETSTSTSMVHVISSIDLKEAALENDQNINYLSVYIFN